MDPTITSGTSLSSPKEQSNSTKLLMDSTSLSLVSTPLTFKKRVYEFSDGNIHDKDILGLRGDLSKLVPNNNLSRS